MQKCNAKEREKKMAIEIKSSGKERKIDLRPLLVFAPLFVQWGDAFTHTFFFFSLTFDVE